MFFTANYTRKGYLREGGRVPGTVLGASVDCNFQRLSVHSVLFIEQFICCLIEINVTKSRDVYNVKCFRLVRQFIDTYEYNAKISLIKVMNMLI